MERKYRTNHQGIAAYLVTLGYEMLRGIPGTNPKTNRPSVSIEFDVDPTTGRQRGDEFYNGNATGNLKAFYDATFEVRKVVHETRGE